MFTGLIDRIGTVEGVRDHLADAAGPGRELRIRCEYPDLVDGESIACDGACLTVREHGAGWFTVAAVQTTLERTAIASWEVGRRLNLERALRVGDRLGGHLVQGHVDGVGVVESVRLYGDATLLDITVPQEVFDSLVPRGSVAVDGVSLTVNALPAPGIVQVSLIEFTLRHTTLGERRSGDRVHVEADLVGRHVRQLLGPHLARLEMAAAPGSVPGSA
ncbi:MAG TPA: riboflavin synthase [Gemmatimonadaceae bacterium]|nr:riboflavin synthase [Gemmatimonadaceae bacterium]